MSAYAPYSNYKSAKVEWLGEIPAHWEETKLKFIGELILGLTYSPEDVVSEGGTLVMRSSNVQGGKITLNDCVYVSSVIPVRLVTTIRDILICSRNGSRDLIGKCALIDESVCGETFGAFMTVFRTNYTKFAYYILSSNLFKFQSGRFLTSTINQLTTETLGGFAIPLPPINEQKTIASFLDFKTAQIDALIAKKQALLEKLAEKRTALISHAVTKGLDPSVPMKDSGVEWLGRIPAHWMVGVKLVYMARQQRHSFVNGPFGSDLLTSELTDEGVPVIYSGDVKPNKFFRKSSSYVTEEKAMQLNFCRVDSGDLLLAKVGDPPGDAAIYPEGAQSGIATQDVVRIKVNDDIADTNYVALLLNSNYGRFVVRTVSVEATRGRFSLGDFKSLRFVMPPLDEQRNIAKELARLMSPILSQEEKVSQVITGLQEYRSALITNAVTGKIDVRQWQVPKEVA